MHIVDFLRADCIQVPLAATTKEGAIRELVMLLAKCHVIPSVDDLCRDFLEREETGPTDYFSKIAMPHIKSLLVSRPCLAIGKAGVPIPWGGFRNQEVEIVCVFAGSNHDPAGSDEALATLVAKLTSPVIQDRLRQSMISLDVFDTMLRIGVDFDPPPGVRLTQNFARERDIVQHLCWAPDGSKVAYSIAGTDHNVRVRDVVTGNLITSMPRHASEVLTIDWTAHGDAIASGSTDKFIHIWRGSDGRHVRQIMTNEEVHGVAWSRDGSRLASAGHTQSVRIWDPNTGQGMPRPEGFVDVATCVRWSPDNVWLAAAGGRRQPGIWVWQARTGRLVKTLPIDRGPILALAWSPDSDLLVAGLADGFIAAWDVATWSHPLRFRAHQDQVTSIDFSWEGRLLASKSMDGTVRLWRTQTWAELACILEPGPEGAYFAPVAYHPTQLKLATLGESGCSIRLWDLDSQQLLRRAASTASTPIHTGLETESVACVAIGSARPAGTTTAGMRSEPLFIPKSLVDHVAQGKVTLFAGAGMSASTVGVTGRHLRDLIGGNIKADFPEYDFSQRLFEEVCDEYVALNDLPGLLNRLASAVPQNVEPSPAHKAAVKLFHVIITTNWDVLFEAAYRDQRIDVQHVIEDEDALNINNARRTLVKMHGCITRPRSLVATTRQYEEFDRIHPKMVHCVTELLRTTTPVFVGYALHDEHIRRLLSIIRVDQGKMTQRAYAVGYFDRVRTKYLEHCGFEVLQVSADEFLSTLSTRCN